MTVIDLSQTQINNIKTYILFFFISIMFELIKQPLAKNPRLRAWPSRPLPFYNYFSHYDISLGIDFLTLKFHRKIRRSNPYSISFNIDSLKPMLDSTLGKSYTLIAQWKDNMELNETIAEKPKVYYKEVLTETPQVLNFKIHEVWLSLPGYIADRFLCNFYNVSFEINPYIEMSFQRIDIKGFFEPFHLEYSKLRECIITQAHAIQKIENQQIFKKSVSMRHGKRGIVYWVGSIRSLVFFRAYVRQQPRSEPQRYFFNRAIHCIQTNDFQFTPLSIKDKDQFLKMNQTMYNIESQLKGNKATVLGKLFLKGDIKTFYFQCLEETLRWAKIPLSLELTNSTTFDPVNEVIKQYLTVTKYTLEQHSQQELIQKKTIKNTKNKNNILEIKKTEFQRMFKSTKNPYPLLVNSLYSIEKEPSKVPMDLPNNFFKFFNVFIEVLQIAGKKSLEEAKYLKFCRTMSQVTDKTKIVFAFNLKIPVKTFLKKCSVKNNRDNRQELKLFIDYLYQYDFEYFYEIQNKRITEKTRLCTNMKTIEDKNRHISQYNLEINSSVFFDILKTKVFFGNTDFADAISYLKSKTSISCRDNKIAIIYFILCNHIAGDKMYNIKNKTFWTNRLKEKTLYLRILFNLLNYFQFKGYVLHYTFQGVPAKYPCLKYKVDYLIDFILNHSKGYTIYLKWHFGKDPIEWFKTKSNLPRGFYRNSSDPD